MLNSSENPHSDLGTLRLYCNCDLPEKGGIDALSDLSFWKDYYGLTPEKAATGTPTTSYILNYRENKYESA